VFWLVNERAEYYRAMAERLRTQAEKMADGDAKAAILDIASRYRSLAEWAERQSGASE
jgi:hypothetical protein